MVFGRGSRGGLVAGVPRDAFRPSGIFIGLVALFITSGVMAWFEFGNARLNVFLFVIAGWIVSLCLHEYAHALLAFRAGDTGVAERGYLRLNPLKYSHPLLSIVLPVVFLLLGGIGLPGGAVWIDGHAIRSRLADTLISLSGPAMNLIFAVGLAIPFIAGVDTAAHGTFWAAVAFLAWLQVTATLLNLMPIPGIDGGNAIAPWLSREWQRYWSLFAPYGMILLFALLFSPQVNALFFGVVDGISGALGVPSWLAGVGRNLFQFWRS